MKRKFACLLVIIILFTVSLKSQKVVFNQVPSPPGGWLSGVISASQDGDGYIWFGSSGVHRYDGYTYKSYFNDPLDSNSLVYNRIEAICADRNGFIWVGTNRMGVDRLDPKTGIFKHFRWNPKDQNTISSDSISAIVEDKDGYIWIGTEVAGLNRIDPRTGKITRFRHDPSDTNSLSYDQVTALYNDRNGKLWIGTGNLWNASPVNMGGLNYFDAPTQKFTRYLNIPNDTTSLMSNNVRVIFEDSRGRFWVGTKGDGLHTMDRDKGKFRRHQYDPSNQFALSRPPPKLDVWPGDMITIINEDAAGTIWIGTVNGGINRYDPLTEKIDYYSTLHENLSETKNVSRFWSSLATKEGVIWILGFDGVFRLDAQHNQIPHYNTDYPINCILQDKKKNLWLGSDNGITVVDSGRSKIDLSPTGKGFWNNQILVLYEDRKGIIWIGTNKALGTYDPVRKHFKQYMENKYITAIYEDKQDGLWIGTATGLALLDRVSGKTRFFVHEKLDSNSISQNFVSHIMEDRAGNLWIGTDERGLNRFDRISNRFLHFLSTLEHVKTFEDTDGVLWAGTSNGLYYLSPDTHEFILFSNDDQWLTRNYHIYQVLEDEQKSLWVNTATGLFRIKQNRKEVVFLGERFESSKWTNQYNCFKGLNGELFFGDNRKSGYFAFFPSRLKENKIPPMLHVAFRIGDGSPVDVSMKENGIDLSYKQNFFTFEFAGMHYSDPVNNKHIYWLENLEIGWRNATSDNTATYNNVPPGNYKFHIKAFNSDGLGVEKIINLRIDPPWWRTNLAYCFYGLLFCTAVFLLISLQRRKLMKDALEKQRQTEVLHAREIEKAYTELKLTQAQLIQSEKMASLGELTAGIAHEIQNPLNFVNNFSDVNTELLEELKSAAWKGNIDEVKTIAEDLINNEQKISHHGKRADAIVKGMLQHSQSAKGQKDLTDINALVDENLRHSYETFRAKDAQLAANNSFKATIKTEFDKSLGKINIIPQDIGKVLRNLYNNAFYALNEKRKFADADYEPTILVTTKKINNTVEIKVTDNGPGIPKNIVDKIFQPFFTTKPTGQGTGLGLSLTYDIVKSNDGEIKVDTKPGEETVFIVSLPIV